MVAALSTFDDKVTTSGHGVGCSPGGTVVAPTTEEIR
jgi:hypothetical protein